jgi:hypothetical protein
MRLPLSGWPDNYPALRLVDWIGIAGLFREIVNNIIDKRLMYCINVIRRIAPDALKLANPIEVHRAKGFECGRHREIQRMWRGS